MALKEKLLGLILIIFGIFPLLLKIKSIANYFANYKFLSYLVPGEIAYQIILVLIGVLLVWKPKPKMNRMPMYR
jgi:hypothetical protein